MGNSHIKHFDCLSIYVCTLYLKSTLELHLHTELWEKVVNGNQKNHMYDTFNFQPMALEYFSY